MSASSTSSTNLNSTQLKPKIIPIGLDLGSCVCCVSAWKSNKIEIIPNEFGDRFTPSYVAFTDTQILVGSDAKNQIHRNPENTIFEFLTLIGKTYDHYVMLKDTKLFPFKIVKETQNKIAFEVTFKGEKQRYFVEEIIVILLNYLKQQILNYFKEFKNKIQLNVVMSVPVCFNYRQKLMIRNCCKKSGLNLLRIVNSSTLAGITYALSLMKKGYDEDRNVLIYDLGGNTINVTLLNVDGGVCDVKSVKGESNLPAIYFNNILMNYFIKEFNRLHNLDITKSKIALSRLRIHCEKLKIKLSRFKKYNIEIDSLYENINFVSSITRYKFKSLFMEYSQHYLFPITHVLENVRWYTYNKSDIDDIVLIGGNSKIPGIKNMIKKYFNGKNHRQNINPHESVSTGACHQAAILSGVKMDKMNDLLLLDVTPFSLRIETSGGITTKFIERNQNIPCKANKTFTTESDNQTKMLIKVFEGEKMYSKDNKLLGYFELKRIQPAPKGVPQIEISLGLDANGVISASAKDKNNESVYNQITIDEKSLLDNFNANIKDLENKNVPVFWDTKSHDQSIPQKIDEYKNNTKFSVTEQEVKESKDNSQIENKKDTEFDEESKSFDEKDTFIRHRNTTFIGYDIKTPYIIIIGNSQYFYDTGNEYNEDEMNVYKNLEASGKAAKDMYKLFKKKYNYKHVFLHKNHQNGIKYNDLDKILSKHKSNITKLITKHKINIDSLLLFYSGHGINDGLILSDIMETSEVYRFNKIFKKFNNDTFKLLNGKPKIYIFDCCRGNSHIKLKLKPKNINVISMGPKNDSTNNKNNPNNESYYNEFTDEFRWYGTINDYKSYASNDKHNSTIMGKAVYEVLLKNVTQNRNWSLQGEIVTRVNRILSKNSLGQVPDPINRLVNQIYFVKNKN